MFICAYIHDTPFLYICTWYARYLALLYVLAGLHLTTLDFYVQILKPGSWWLGCSWSECAADPPMVDRAQSKLGRHRSSSFQFLSCLTLRSLLLLVSISQFCYVYPFVYHTFVFLVMHYSCDVVSLSVVTCTCTFLLECILPLCFRTLILVLYWCLAYIRDGTITLRMYIAVASSYPPDRGATMTFLLRHSSNWHKTCRTKCYTE